MISLAINGCGRIGKTLLRLLVENQANNSTIHIKALNLGPADKEALAYFIKYDSVMGAYAGDVAVEGSTLHIGGREIALYTETDARKLPWGKLGIDWVVDVSGKYTHRAEAQQHIDAGAGAVLISAPAQGDDITIVPGVNDQLFDPRAHKIISLGSCTTNAAVPILHILMQTYTLESALLNTVHAYTNTQALLDSTPSMHDLRRSRAAALNMVPTTTGAMESVFRVLPGLKGKLAGSALRVPVPVVSLVDITFTASEAVAADKLLAAFAQAAAGSLKNIMAVTDVPLVSTDFEGNPHSVIVDATMTNMTGKLGRVFGWYDNEYGYSCRLRDFLWKVGNR